MFSWLRMLARPEALAAAVRAQRLAEVRQLEAQAREAKRLLVRALVMGPVRPERAEQVVEMALAPLVTLAQQQALDRP